MNKIKLDLEIKEIEMNDNTFRMICPSGEIISRFKYMNNYQLKQNDYLKDYECRLIFTNNLGVIVELNLDDTIKLSACTEFNERNIRELANKCFSKDMWCLYKLKQFNDTEMNHRSNMNREEFIDNVVKGCVDGKVMHLTREWHRGISKSYFINELAKMFEIPIFREFKGWHGKDDDIYTHINQLRDLRIDKILVDECSVETVEKIRNMGIKPIGFACTYKNYELI